MTIDKRAILVAFSLACVLAGRDSRLRAQTSVAAPKVEVATIRRNKDIEGARASVPPGTPIAPARLQVLPGGRMAAMGISTMELIRSAYGYENRPAADVAGPGWIDIERFDITIKADQPQFGPPGPLGVLPQDAAHVARDFLADRFKLHVRMEKKEQTIFELRLAHSDGKLGPGLTPSDGSCVGIYAPPGPLPRCPFVLGGGRGVQVGHLTMPELAVFFTAFPAVNAEVVDKTGLTGAFDIKMSAFIGGGVANAAPDDPRPQMFTAVQDMLGLKLERTKGLATIIVVEHVERPTEN